MKAWRIKIPYAERDGELVHVSSVESGLECGCVCPVCKEAVVARKGDVNRHHFAHYVESDCDAESVLHFMGKTLLQKRISRHIRDEAALPIQWDCYHCGERHEGDMLKLARSVETEYSLYGCRPDLVLFDDNDRPLSFVEVVATHAPENHVRECCQTHDVVLVQFHISNGRDLLALEHEQPLRPNLVDLCMHAQCSKCGGMLSPARLYIIDIPCWRCGLTMPAAVVRSEEHLFGPEKFDSEQAREAGERGALLQQKYSLTSQKTYLTNTCPSCGAFTGPSYLRQFSPQTRKVEGADIGLICVNCGDAVGGDN